MSRVFAPAVSLLNHLNYPRKFGLIGFLFALPLALVTYFLVSELNARVEFSERELKGNEYLSHLQKFTSDLREHRGLLWSQRVDPSAQKQLAGVLEQLQQDLKAIDFIDKRHGGGFETTEMWSALKTDFGTLGLELEKVDPADPGNRHTNLIAGVITLMSHVGDQSNLILDSELDSFYLMDLAVNRLPELSEQVGQLRGYSSRLGDEKTDLQLTMFRLRNQSSAITSQLQTLSHHFRVTARETQNLQLVKELNPKVDKVVLATSEFLSAINRGISAGTVSDEFIDDVWNEGSEAQHEYDNLYSQVSVSLDQLLTARISRLRTRRTFVVTVSLCGTLLGVYLFAAFYLAVMRTVAQLDAATVSLLNGSTSDVSIQVDTQDELGQITRSFGALAERLQTESIALRNSERRMRTILDGAVDAMITIDELGIIESTNAATSVLFGYLPNELIGRNVKMLMPEPLRSQHDGYLHRYLSNGEKRILGSAREVQALRKDGTLFFADLTVSEVELDDRRVFTGVVRDMTDRKKTSDELATLNARLTGVLNAATQVSIISTDMNGLITLFNSGAENLLGYSAEEMIGKQSPQLIHLPEEVTARGRELSLEFGYPVEGFDVFVVYANQGRYDRREWTYIAKDGRRFSVNLTVTAVKMPQEKSPVSWELPMTSHFARRRKQSSKNVLDWPN